MSLERLQEVRWQSLLVFILAFGLYANTLGHGFVLDDGLVITDNPYVQAGIRGIPDILSHDSFHGTLGESAYLSGGRYRPLSLVMFAMEVSFFGKSPYAHHLINVLLYAITAIVLLGLLRRVVFRSSPWAALAATVLFIIHPLHTEVVANIKSRDEILSLLFLLLALRQFLIDPAPGGAFRASLSGGCLYMLALLSKENGIIFLAIAPLAVLTFSGRSWQDALRVCWPLLPVAVLYGVLRSGITGTHLQEVPGVLDNPYVLASPGEKLATVLFVLLKYVSLLVWPDPLTYDYSYAQVPYRDFADPAVWAGSVLLVLLLVLATRSLFRRDLFGWSAAFFLSTWLLVSGLFINIGAPMAERFLYQAGLPFILACVEGARRLLLLPGLKPITRPALSVAMLVLCVPQVWLTLDRNTDWRDRDDLLLHDVVVSSRSARANTYAGIACIRKSLSIADARTRRELAARSLIYFATADSIVPDYVPVLLNRGTAYALLDSIGAAENSWDRVRELEPGNSLLRVHEAWLFDQYYRKGLQAGVNGDVHGAIEFLNKAVRYGPGKADAWYNLGGAQFTAGDTANARLSWQRTLQIDGTNRGALQGLRALGDPPVPKPV